MMEFNSAVMRSAMESANMFKQARVMFVPMPVMDQQDLMDLLRQSGERLEKLAVEAEESNDRREREGERHD